MTHTPGPWHLHDAFGNQDGVGVYRGETQIAGVFGRSRDDLPRQEADAETHANARLIAAAPDLLNALKMQVTYRMRDGSPCGCPAGREEDEPTGTMPLHHSTSCQMLRDALANVEGRAE